MKKTKFLGIVCLIVAILILGFYLLFSEKKQKKSGGKKQQAKAISEESVEIDPLNPKDELAIIGDEAAGLNSENAIKAKEVCQLAASLKDRKSNILGMTLESGFNDLSFVYYCLSHTGLIYPRVGNYEDLYSKALTFSKADCQPADIIFFGKHDQISHVGILIENHHMVHVTDRVEIIDLNRNDYYKEHILGYGNYISYYKDSYREEDTDKYEKTE